MSPDWNALVGEAVELSRFFYRAVGGDWYWLDRLDWTYDQWRDWVTAPGHELWTCWVDGVPAGYFELEGDSPYMLLVAPVRNERRLPMDRSAFDGDNIADKKVVRRIETLAEELVRFTKALRT